ncbi:hypothetical protein N7G274_006616 [Stereocaulon virgatum]|uniref:Glutathione S-transferase n=1 Tax=Stereocaulon virgatum TaxID=373712 RepID=A0ABR4A8E7_9LECA
MPPSPASKRQKTTSSSSSSPEPPYELLYWPGIPGRGEHIRLCFEATRTPYTDVVNASKSNMPQLTSLISDTNIGDATNPPPLAPPVLRHGKLLVSQTPNILLYLAPQLGLAGPEDDGTAIYHVNQLALTALDGLSNEAHDTHHPVATGAYYEEQKAEAKKKAEDYVAKRLPKFLGYFERVLQSGASKGGEYLYAGVLTYADLVLWQCLDGVMFAFPKALGKMREGGEYGKVFGLHERVKGRKEIEEYLGSERRMKYSRGIYRHYPELDAE